MNGRSEVEKMCYNIIVCTQKSELCPEYYLERIWHLCWLIQKSIDKDIIKQVNSIDLPLIYIVFKAATPAREKMRCGLLHFFISRMEDPDCV